MRDNDLVELQYYNVDSALYFCDTPVQAFNKVQITIYNMTKPNRFLKIYNIADGITRQFYKEELENVEIIEQITNNNKALNINEASLKILPQTSTGVLFQRTLPFAIYRNDQLYGQFFIKSSTSNTNKTLYSLKVNDYISLLEGQTFLGGLYTEKNVGDLIEEVLGDLPYTLDNTLASKTVSGYLPILNKREALRQIAFTINAIVDTSRSTSIEIRPTPTSVTSTLGVNEIYTIETTQENITTKIMLETTVLTTKNAETDNIFNEKLNGTTYVIFDNPMFNLAITGGTIVDSNCNYAILQGTGARVTLTGKEYVQATMQASKTNPYTVTTDIEKIETYTTTLTCDNEDILDNLNFVEYKIKSRFEMGDIKVGDLVSLNGQTCRVMQINYDIAQTNIVCDAELEAYYG